MRITLDLDEDVLASVRDIARRESKTTGQVLSELTRSVLTQAVAPRDTANAQTATGFIPFDSRGAIVTDELIDKLSARGE